ncbi:hypothetical protein [Kitasatospora purpeofusca]|uniref:hypothetical protein n=1 Tax=Kitasatospora purpeofusca TaxID=67352 RepID=UPI0036D3374A
MSVPEVVPIAYEPDYRTDTIGRFRGGQFLASVTFAVPQGAADPRVPSCFAVLHRFDDAGRHLDSRIEAVPGAFGGEVAKTAGRLLERWLDALPEREFGDVAIAPFAVHVDGVLFGLVLERHHEGAAEDDWAELYPDRLGFHAPWDGTYDT